MTNTDKWQERDYRRQQIIMNAVEVADRIILDGSDGTAEETDYLTGEVARKFVEKALNPFSRNLLRKEVKGGE